MAVVEEFMLGKTKIKINDKYCKDKTPEDVQEILTRLAKIAALGYVKMQTNNK